MSDTASIRDVLHTSYDRAAWQLLLENIFPQGSLSLLRTPEDLSAEHEKVTATRQLGTLTLPGDDEKIALLEITTTDQIKLARNRVGLRNFVASFIDQANASAVLAVFTQPDSPDWRLTFAAKKTTLDQDTFEITTIETAPRRFTFLLGQNEPCRTAAARLATIAEKGDELSLRDLEVSFSVESLTKDFFKKYKGHYQTFIDYLLSDSQSAGTRELFEIPELDDAKEQEKADKPVRDFVKTLLGRLVFLHFLQKKGWLGCPENSRQWRGGDTDFLQSFLQQARDANDADVFHSEYLSPLFFEALNTADRPKDIFPLTGTRLPYLNGGLFDDEHPELREINFPEQLFTDLLNFFGEYNFTIDENDPEDHEVGIDPEMLGMIFENLLEDNKEKGAYYTPKAIVSYMARQSLLHYLQTHLGENKELEQLLNEKDISNAEDYPFVIEHKQEIASLLEKVTICDPAIGSGAFPIGLLHEILWTRLTLEPEKNTPEQRAALKRRIIQDSIHGVDIDPGAIEIARLRFWLTLVVDEDEPRPLPNLDYKIHRADSLIEYIRGEAVNLGVEAPKDDASKAAVADLITAKQELFIAQRIPEKRNAWFALYRALAKLAQAEFTWMRQTDFENAERLDFLTKGIHDFGQWVGKIDTIKKQRVHHQDTLLAELKAWFDDPEHPTFLWNLHFGGIFADGGFDIVIANPPYVRQELIKPIKPLLKDRFETFTGTADLFVSFYEQAHNLLRENGVLTFITSNKYYRAGYGKKIRQFLAEKQTIRTLIDFRDAPIFNEVIAYASIYVGQNTPPPTKHFVNALPWDLDKPAATLPIEIQNAFPVSQDALTPDGWRLVPPHVTALLEKLRTKGTPLGEYVDGRFYYGIKTGFNEAFVIDGAKRSELIAADPKSREIIKPFLRGRDVKRWKSTHEDLWVIATFPSLNLKIQDYPAVEQFLRGFYPKIKQTGEHLTDEEKRQVNTHAASNGIELSEKALKKSRKSTSGKWFETQDNIAYWQEFNQPKIVLGRFMNSPLYCFDDDSNYISNASSIIGGQGQELASMLNANTSWWFLTSTTTDLQNGYLQAHNNNHSPLPIPPATGTDKTKLAILAERCTDAALAGDQAALAAHEHEINQIVYRLFNLTEQEIYLIESSLGIESTPIVIDATGSELPATQRPAALGSALNYLLEFLPQVFRVAGEAISLEQLFSSYYLLTDLQKNKAAAKQAIGDNAEPWIKSFAEPTDSNEFIDAFRGLIASNDIQVTPSGLLQWVGESYGVTKNPWIHCDARFTNLMIENAPEKLPQPTPAIRDTVLSPIRTAYQVA